MGKLEYLCQDKEDVLHLDENVCGIDGVVLPQPEAEHYSRTKLNHPGLISPRRSTWCSCCTCSALIRLSIASNVSFRETNSWIRTSPKC